MEAAWNRHNCQTRDASTVRKLRRPAFSCDRAHSDKVTSRTIILQTSIPSIPSNTSYLIVKDFKSPSFQSVSTHPKHPQIYSPTRNHGIKPSLPQIPNSSMGQQRQRKDRRRIPQRRNGKLLSPARPTHRHAAPTNATRSSRWASSSSSTPPSSPTPPSTGPQFTSRSSTGSRSSAARWA